MEDRHNVYRRKIIAVLVLLAVWQLLSAWVDRVIFLPSATDTLKALASLVQTREFYLSIGTSFLRISSGFAIAVASGVLLAILAECNAQLGEILQLLMQLIKSIPVASFVILVLLWVRSSQLSIVISYLMVLPVIFTNVRGGIRQTDRKLLEMAKIYKFSAFRKMRYIYLPSVRPAFVTACSVGVGFCWKSGIAAEVIGLPKHSIGTQLYESKLYLMTPELFAWTAVIVIISILFEKLVMRLIRGMNRHSKKHGRKASPSDSMGRREHPQEWTSRAGQAAHPNQPPSFSGGKANLKTAFYGRCITIKNLWKCYGSQTVLSGISRSIKYGERLCIMGASGIGKTTLLSILAGLETPDSGMVSGLEGRRLSMVFQEDRLFEEEDAFTNVAAALNLPSASSETWLRAEFAQIGLTNYEGKPVSEFSGGMRRRVAIVRAICADSNIVLFDEPLKGLDEKSRGQVIEYIKNRAAGRTLLVVTHDETDARLLDADLWNLGHPQ